jgi:hypothetical protein
MGRWRSAWAWARRPLLAALTGGLLGTGLARSQQRPFVETGFDPVPPEAVNVAPPAPAVAAPPTSLPPAAVSQLPAAGAAVLPLTSPPPPTTEPAIGAGTAGQSATCGPAGGGAPAGEPPFNWAKVPPVTPVPRPGWFIITPTGPGYYSLEDLLTGNYRRQAPRFPYGLTSLNSASSFNYDFRFLEDPNNPPADWAERLKRLHFGESDEWMFSTGGETRWRYADEINSRGLGRTNTYDLYRLRTYGDLWYKDEYRVFVEFLYAQTFYQDLAPLPIDATGPDLLNAFVEAKVGEPLGNPLYIRAGRQELLYGSQRLISPLDWANTRRTFQGVKAYWHSEQLDVDAFWTQPVVPNPDRFDSVDTNRNFFGLWTTYKPKPGTTFDLYYLGLTTANAPNNGDVQTLGSRYAGDIHNRFLYDVEGAVQFGERDGRHIFAQMGTGGFGYHFPCLPWNPEVWAYYDFASGDKDPTGPGSYRTFNQLFPYGHYYLGFLDLVGRQNIRDLNFQFSVNPQPWITSLVQFHRFWLDARKDALYNAAGVPIRRDPTGLAGDDVGEELDFLTNFHLTMHQDLLVGYSKFFAGKFWQRTGPPTGPELLYVQYSYRW